jgi:hypothetical protein
MRTPLAARTLPTLGPVALVALVALVAACAACAATRDTREPGEKLGTFAVNGALLGTTCGKAAPTFRYEVRLSREGNTLNWVQGSTVPVQGTVDERGGVRMVAELDVVVTKADERAGVLGCTMHRTDTLSATLQGEPPTSFVGALVYKFSAKAGDCAAQLASAGGDFAALPCTMTYDVKAAALGQ